MRSEPALQQFGLREGIIDKVARGVEDARQYDLVFAASWSLSKFRCSSLFFASFLDWGAFFWLLHLIEEEV